MNNDEGSRSAEPSPNSEDIPLDVIPLHSTDLLTVLDESGVIRYESPSIENLFGYEQDELVGQQVSEYFHPEDSQRVRDVFQTVVSQDGYTVEAIEYRHKQADETYRWVESVGASNPTPQGHYVINTRDISERKEREQALELKNERLDQFASVVSHDLRNPLNVAQLRAELALEECDSPHLVSVIQAQDRMEALIDDLLTLARAGGQIDTTEVVHLSDLAETCWQTVATANATLVTEGDCTIYADQSQLQQLLENLFRNAVEHGGEDVTITIGPLEPESGFYVADTGSGIPAVDHESVFESGFSTRQDGTGFGLPIVRDIADAHGWEVTLVPNTEQGTRFEFSGVDLYQ